MTTVDFVAPFEQQLGQVGSVLARDSRDQGSTRTVGKRLEA
jgi:hypothetical protein